MAKGRKTGGRVKGVPNKATADLRAIAGKYCKEAITGLVTIARTGQSEAARVMAWREVLDRYAGKPAQAITDADGEPLTFPTSVALIIRQQPGAENRT
jgi:hypothetical protein